MTTSVANRWPLLRVLLTSHLTFVAMLWVLFTVVVTVITGIVAAVGGVSESVLHHAATQVPRWLMFGLGIDAVSTYLRMHLAHGRTRREFAGQALVHAVVTAGFAAVLITVGYLLERGFYALFGWPQALPREGLFSATDQYPAILGAFWLSLLLWMVAGLVIGLGFFRSTGLGLLTIPLGLVIVLPALVAVRNDGLPVVDIHLAGLDLTAVAVLAGAAAVLAMAIGVFWAVVRYVPLKPSSS